MTETTSKLSRWEYCERKTSPGEPLSELLRVMGDLGWEAWHVDRRGIIFNVQFKRPKQ